MQEGLHLFAPLDAVDGGKLKPFASTLAKAGANIMTVRVCEL